jgi:glycosyltransferase involved in cell wall biosynthesis
MTHKVVAVSEAVRRSILENCNELTERTVTIPNGIDLQVIRSRHVDADSLRQALGIPTDAYVVGNVASLSPAKGHIYLLDALVQLRCWNPKVCALMVGRDAGSEAQLKARIRELDLQDNVILTGYRTDAIELMQTFDVFVIPSLFEGMPVALLEAMALGKPVVVTAVGGNIEVVRHSIEGMVVPPGDSEALAEAIKFLIKNPEIANSYGYHAQKRVEAEFTLERMVDRYLNVYHEVLEVKR